MFIVSLSEIAIKIAYSFLTGLFTPFS